MNYANNNLRMSTVRWLGRHLAIDLDLGALTVSEYNLIMKTLRAVARKGDTKEPDIPIRLVDGREAADVARLYLRNLQTGKYSIGTMRVDSVTPVAISPAQIFGK